MQRWTDGKNNEAAACTRFLLDMPRKFKRELEIPRPSSVASLRRSRHM